MKDIMGATKDHRRQGNINKLITPELRQQIRELGLQLDGYDYRIFDLFYNIQEALDIAGLSVFFDDVNQLNSFQTALETAEDLRDRRPLETWEARKKRKEEAAKHEDSWDWR